MKTIWIETALKHGAQMLVRQKGKKINVKMRFDTMHDDIDTTAYSLETACDKLDDALCEDAANEMIESGSV